MWINSDGYLREEDEYDPLVPGVSDLIPVLGHLDQVRVGGARVGTDPGVGVVPTHPPGQLGGQREGAVDPAEGVEQVPGHTVHIAVDRVAEVLLGGLEEAGDAEEEEGVLIVQPEREVVNQAVFKLKISSESVEKI